MKKQTGTMPLFKRTPKQAEWRLLGALAIDMKDYIDANDLKVILDIAEKRDKTRYAQLSDYWGLQSIDPNVQMVGTRDACLYQLSSFLKKIQWEDSISPHQIEAANATFFKYENAMRQYNRKGIDELRFGKDPLIPLWLTRMRHFISSVLGRFDAKAITRYAKPGPGGTYGTASQFGHRFYKYANVPYEVTKDALPLARHLIYQDERWCRALLIRFVIPNMVWYPCAVTYPCVLPFTNGSFMRMRLPEDSTLFRVVPGNRVEYVPKKEEEARTIALEANMNVQLQLGVDGHIRKRLKKFGIDINCQNINQELARIGSIDNSLSTIDLSGASDNISLALVELLLPFEWLEYLYKLRSDLGFMPDGTIVRYEKLSSMGNGYTFAVETLVFAACVYAVNPEVRFGTNSHVYGDDIIVPTSDTPALLTLLKLCGFSINIEKSFTGNNFVRESCGADFLQGENIRPVFLRVALERLDVFAFFSLHNSLYEWFSRVLPYSPMTSVDLLKGWCAPKWLLFGPPDLEDKSAYLFSPKPLYGRTKSGLYRHDRAIARVKEYDEKGDWFRMLCHDLKPARKRDPWEKDVAGGNRFSVTKRGRYRIGIRKQTAVCFAWPENPHDV